ncbi:MAG: DegT/DnrJ/EryC1/StrS family aminotransferase [Egibacteraceae bacterium]
MIPLVRPLLGQEERAAVERVLASGLIAQGPEVAAFEEEFSALVNHRRCVAVSSGTAALHLGLLAAGIGSGDQVIVPSFSFAASANAVRLCGATAVFADIEPGHFCLDPAAVEAAVTPATAAIMAVHLYGHPADMAALTAIADRHGLLVVEDAAQAHGARLHGQPAGALGHLAAFSFYATKNMTTGEGGMITTGDEQVARTTRLLRNQGMSRPYHHEVIGFNVRMTDLAAAIGRVQLGRLPGWNDARRANARRYDAGLRGVVTPPVADRVEHAYHQYTVRSPDRDTLRTTLAQQGVGCGVYYPVPIHRQPPFAIHRQPPFATGADLPETDRAAAEVLSLPIRPDLTDDEIETVIKAVNQ